MYHHLCATKAACFRRRLHFFYIIGLLALSGWSHPLHGSAAPGQHAAARRSRHGIKAKKGKKRTSEKKTQTPAPQVQNSQQFQQTLLQWFADAGFQQQEPPSGQTEAPTRYRTLSFAGPQKPIPGPILQLLEKAAEYRKEPPPAASRAVSIPPQPASAAPGEKDTDSSPALLAEEGRGAAKEAGREAPPAAEVCSQSPSQAPETNSPEGRPLAVRLSLDCPPLYDAIARGKLKTAATLLGEGASPEAPATFEGNIWVTPLGLTIKEGDLKSFSLLLEDRWWQPDRNKDREAYVNSTGIREDKRHFSMLYLAASLHRTTMVKRLLACGANPLLTGKVKENCYSRSVLSIAKQKGYSDIVECLQAATTKMARLQDKDTSSPSLLVLRDDGIPAATHLLSPPAPPEPKGHSGHTSPSKGAAEEPPAPPPPVIGDVAKVLLSPARPPAESVSSDFCNGHTASPDEQTEQTTASLTSPPDAPVPASQREAPEEPPANQKEQTGKEKNHASKPSGKKPSASPKKKKKGRNRKAPLARQDTAPLAPLSPAERLAEAIRYGDVPAFRTLLAQTHHLDLHQGVACHDGATTLLRLAVAAENQELLAALLEHQREQPLDTGGTVPELPVGIYNPTPLFMAIEKDMIEAAELLLSHGACLHPGEKFPPVEEKQLLSAVEGKCHRLLELLLKARTQPPAPIQAPALECPALLSAAIAHKDPAGTDLLLRYDADPNLFISEGDRHFSPISFLMRCQHERPLTYTLLAQLIQAGAQLLPTERIDPDTARRLLVYAVRQKHPQVARRLLAWGADANNYCWGPQGETIPLLCLALEGGHPEMVRVLLQGGATAAASIHKEESEYMSALYFALHTGHDIAVLQELATLLVAAGCQPNRPVWRPDGAWDLPILAAMRMHGQARALAMTSCLLQLGASPFLGAAIDGGRYTNTTILDYATHQKELAYMVPFLQEYQRQEWLRKLVPLSFGVAPVIPTLPRWEKVVGEKEKRMKAKEDHGVSALLVLILNHDKDKQQGTLLLLLRDLLRNLTNPCRGAHMKKNTYRLPLTVALYKGCEEVARLLLTNPWRKANASQPTLTDGAMETPLWIAVCKENLAMVQLLAGEGKANPAAGYSKEADSVYITPLFEAIRRDQKEIASYLVQQGKRAVCLRAQLDPHSFQSPLYAAVARGWRDLTADLLQAGAHPGVAALVEGGSTTPLGLAIHDEDFHLAELLLENPWCKADPNQIALSEGENSLTPLWVAVHHELPSFVRLLLRHGANRHLTGSGVGATSPLCEARERGRTDIAQLLLSPHLPCSS